MRSSVQHNCSCSDVNPEGGGPFSFPEPSVSSGHVLGTAKIKRVALGPRGGTRSIHDGGRGGGGGPTELHIANPQRTHKPKNFRPPKIPGNKISSPKKYKT